MLILNQYTVTTSTVPIFTIPPGTGSVELHLAGTIPVYLGTSANNVAATSAYAVSVTPVNWSFYPMSKGETIYGFATGATSLNVAISTGS